MSSVIAFLQPLLRTPPPFRARVRTFPSAESVHFSIAGCHATIPQKSPIFAQTTSGAAVDLPITFESTANAGKVASSNAATEMPQTVLIAYSPHSFRLF